MKRKHIISSAVLSIAMALGVGASIASVKSHEVHASESDTWSICAAPGWGDVQDFSWDANHKFYGQESNGRFAATYTFGAGVSFKARKDHDWTTSVGWGGNTGQGIGTYLVADGDNFQTKSAGTYLVTLKDGVADYGDKSYGFAICKVYNITIMDGASQVGSIYFEDYNDSGCTITYTRDSFAKAGYYLEGLYAEAGLSNKVDSGTVTGNQSLTLYAKYVEEPQNTFYLYDPRSFLTSGDGYIYAFDDGGHENAPFPGVKMTEVDEHLYSKSISTVYTTLIFGDGSTGYGNIQTTNISDADQHGGEYFVLTHKDNDGRLAGEWWTSTTSPYSVQNGVDTYQLSLNLECANTVREFLVTNANVRKMYHLDFYKNESIIPGSYITPESGANAKTVSTYIQPHNNADNVTICLKGVSKFTWHLWVGGYESFFGYTKTGSATVNELYKSPTTPEGYKARYATSITVQKNDVIEFHREDAIISPTGLSIKSGANLYKDGSDIKVHNDADLVVLELLIKNDDSFEINLAGFEEVRRLDVIHSDTTVSSYNVVNHNENEYKTETSVSVVPGDLLAYYVDDSIQTMTAKVVGNNNCFTNDKGEVEVSLYMDSTIYINFTNSTIFAGGMTQGEFGLVVDKHYVRMSHNEHPVDPTFTEWYKKGYSFAENAVIEVVDTTKNEGVGGPVIFSVLKINEHSTAGFEIVDSKLKCSASGGKTTDIYVKFKSGFDEVYFGDVSEADAAAIAYAVSFNEKIGGVCKADGSTSTSELATKWSEVATEFASVIEAGQTILTNATKDHANDDIKEFAKKYDMVFGKYGTSLSLSNFASRSVSESAPYIPVVTNNQTQIMVIVICSIASLSALGIILVIKRRRTNIK